MHAIQDRFGDSQAKRAGDAWDLHQLLTLHNQTGAIADALRVRYKSDGLAGVLWLGLPEPTFATATGRSAGPTSTHGPFANPVRTVGAAQRLLTPSIRIACQMRSGSTLRRATCVAPAAVTAQGKHHPLQWNFGSVQKEVDRASGPVCETIASACSEPPGGSTGRPWVVSSRRWCR